MLKGIGLVSADLGAADLFTADTDGGTQAATGTKGIRIKNYFNLSISGTWDGKITIQRSFDDGVTWLDIRTYIANVEDWDREIESGVLYRVGFKAAEYTSGTAKVRISR